MNKLKDILYINYGIIVITVQVIIIRELLIIFGGNELSVGITLCSWLFSTAAGSYVFSKINIAEKRIIPSVSVLFILLTVIVPAMIFLIRLTKSLMHLQTGELVGIFSIGAVSFVMLFPFCFLSGALFPALSRLNKYLSDKNAPQSVSRVYVFEGAGALIGGILLNFILLHHLSAFRICFIVSLLCLTSSLYVTSIKRKILFSISGILIIPLSILFLLPLYNKLETISLQYQWNGYTVLQSENTIYGQLVVLQESLQNSIYQNGLILFSSSDIISAEESVHLALLQHPEPKNILLIGGGISGGIKQALKHKSITNVDYVELDPKVIELGKKYLQEDDLPGISGKNVSIFNTDGRQFIKRCKKKYDCITSNIPDPHNAQFNRFYTVEFFSEISRILNNGGIFSLSVTSSENYINDPLANFLKSIYSSLKVIFKDTIIIPGNTAAFISCNKKGILTDNPADIINTIKERGLNTLYINESYLPFRMSKDRLDYINTSVLSAQKSAVNKDFKPIGYYYNTILWSAYFNENIRTIFEFLYNLKYREVIFVLLPFIFLIPFIIIKGKRSITAAVYTAGFSVISLEVLIILSFQILNGYIYSAIALITAGYMGGLALGGWIFIKIINSKSKTYLWLRRIQFIFILLPLLSLFTFFLVSKMQTGSIHTNAFLFILLIITGFLGGGHFQLSNTLYMHNSPGKNWGTVYSIDLFGSCIGAALISSILIPLTGIYTTCIYLSILNLTGFIALTFYKSAK